MLSSPIIAPIKFLHRRFGVGGDFFNYFDGNVDLLDDLDDHYTARTHKKERNALVERLQGICRDHSVRITILSGDVHLCAVGRFYSKLSLGLAAENDYRYMPNVISSAITNKPPPQAVANLLARRNKIHHLDRNTEETLLKVFDKDPGNTCKTAKHNKVTMPSRNFAMITENSPNNPAPAAATTTNGTDAGHRANGRTAPRTDGTPAAAENGRPASSSSSSSSSSSNSDHGDDGKQDKFPGKDGHYPLHRGEAGAGTSHKAAQTPGSHGRGRDGSLDVCLRVEIDQHDPLGRTQGYGLTVPALTVTAEKARDAHIHGLRAADKLKDKAKSKAEDKTGRAAPQSAVGGVGAEMAQMHEMQEVRS